MTAIEELAATLNAIRAAFDALEIRWVVGGSLASAAYGEPRATNDIDVVALLDEGAARQFGRVLGPEFYFSEAAAVDAVRAHQCFNVIDQRTFIKVDVFVPDEGPLGRGQLKRRRMLELVGGVVVPVLGPEDVVLQKLRWFRMGGGVSDRQWRDLVQVVRAGSLDDAYLDEVAATVGLQELLARARTDASEA
jgi:hypothetical protein